MPGRKRLVGRIHSNIREKPDGGSRRRFTLFLGRTAALTNPFFERNYMARSTNQTGRLSQHREVGFSLMVVYL